jgi:hypothetical protein
MGSWPVLIGDLTEQGYMRKKMKLNDEITQIDSLCHVKSEPTIIDLSAQGKTVAETMASFTQSNLQCMSETIAKWFKKPIASSTSLSVSKPTLKKSSKKPKPIIKVLETVLVPVETSGSIPQGNVRLALQKKGYINLVKVVKSDSEPVIRSKIHERFPSVFFNDTDHKQFDFMSAKSRSVKAISPKELGFTSWTGEAIIVLAGQGCLYVLPLILSQKKESAIDNNIPTVILNVIGHSTCITAVQSLVTAKPAISAVLPEASLPSSSKSDQQLTNQMNNPFIAGLILELAGRKADEIEVSW